MGKLYPAQVSLVIHSYMCVAPSYLPSLTFLFKVFLNPNLAFFPLFTVFSFALTYWSNCLFFSMARGLHVKHVKYSTLSLLAALPSSPMQTPLSVSCAAAVIAASEANVLVETKEVC